MVKLPATAKLAFNDTSPSAVIVELKVAASVTAKVELNVVASVTSKVELNVVALVTSKVELKVVASVTSKVELNVVASVTARVELKVVALSTCKVESIVVAPPTERAASIETSPTIDKIELIVTALSTCRVDSMEVAPTTVKVLPKLTSPTISPLPEARREPDTSKLALVESLRLPIPVDAVSLWKVITSNDTSFVVMTIPLLSNDNTVTSSPFAEAPIWRELPLTKTDLNGFVSEPRVTLLFAGRISEFTVVTPFTYKLELRDTSSATARVELRLASPLRCNVPVNSESLRTVKSFLIVASCCTTILPLKEASPSLKTRVPCLKCM